MSESTQASASNHDAAATKAKRIKDKIAASSARNSGKAPQRHEGTSRQARDGAGDRSFLARALDEHPLALLAGEQDF